jgi:GNAT superfamily N-acetyltransferase
MLAQATACNPAVVTVRIDGSIEGINWAQAKVDLAADNFDSRRTPEALGRSFRQSQHVAFTRDGDRVVGMARLLSDGVCDAYLLDVWTASAYRRQGIASAMIRQLLESAGAARRVADRRSAGGLRVARFPRAARVLVGRRRLVARQRR